MFDRLLFKNSPGYGPLIDVGTLAESLIFYGHVDIVCNSATLTHLVRHIPPNILLSLLHSQRATLYLLNEQVAIHTETRFERSPLHRVVKIAAHDPTAKQSAERALLTGTKDRSVARRILRELQPLSHGTFGDGAYASTLMNDRETSRLAMTALKAAVPAADIPSDSFFNLEPDEDGFVVQTNIDFAHINQIYHQAVPKSHSSVTPAWLLALVKGAHEDLYFAATFRSEIATREITHAILSGNVQSILKKTQRSHAQMEAFKNLTLDAGHSLREAVNTGTVPFSAVVKLLSRAEKFRDWLDNQPDDADLAREYYKATISNTWIEKLPAKTTRWAIFTGLGAMVDSQLGTGVHTTIAAQGLSALDTFLLDRLIGGWKPHHFIERELHPLITALSNKPQKEDDRKPQ